MNFTITAPEGSTNHGNPQLICTPPQVTDYIIFFFANYFAHAASIVVTPGQTLASTSYFILLALILPGSGIIRALSAILRHASTESKNPVKRAARAGALCMVVRKSENMPPLLRKQVGKLGDIGWYNRSAKTEASNNPEKATVVETGTSTAEVRHPGSNVVAEPVAEVSNSIFENEAPESQEVDRGTEIQPSLCDSSELHKGYFCVAFPLNTSIHGEQWFDEKFHHHFYLGIVPPLASLQLAPEAGKGAPKDSEADTRYRKSTLASSHNLLRPFISVIQAIWGAITIYHARGDQIQEYGYAAFGLTVAPYVFMSIVNALANILTPDYPSMFLIRTRELGEAEMMNIASFKGVIWVEKETTKHEEAETNWCSLHQAMTTLDNFFFSREDGNFLDRLDSFNPLDRLDSSNCLDRLDSFYSLDRLKNRSQLVLMGLGWLLGLIPLAIIGGISRFHKGNSTQLERGFSMAWLVVGIVYGVFMLTYNETLETTFNSRGIAFWKLIRPYIILLLGVGVPAVGGMVVVGRMIYNFGICSLIT